MVSDIKIITIDIDEKSTNNDEETPADEGIKGAAESEDDDYSEPLKIEFYIPKDNIITFNERIGHHLSRDGELTLINYSGPIGIPRGVAINIPNRYNTIDIEGIIDSPAHITGLGPLDIIINPKSELELLVNTSGLLIIDKRLSVENPDDYGIRNYRHGDRLFSEIKKRYLEDTINKISPPSILDTHATMNADFRNSRVYSIRDIDICIQENLVNIRKDDGISNIFYDNVEYKKIDITNKKPTVIDNLRIDLKNAEDDENYEKAAKIRDDIRRREQAEDKKQKVNRDKNYNR